MILANPAQGLGRTLRLSRSATARQEEVKAFDRDQLARFLRATAKIWPRFYSLFLTMARTGMRIGEALALQWDDVDFMQREIRVARAISSTGQVDTPKAGYGRTVDMRMAVKDVLERLRTARQEKARPTASRSLRRCSRRTPGRRSTTPESARCSRRS